MTVSWDCQGPGSDGGRVRGEKGAMWNGKYQGVSQNLPKLSPPPLPPSVQPGGHGGSHGQLMNEFVSAILAERKPLVDISTALNLTVGGIVAHQSAFKDGETLKIPQYAANQKLRANTRCKLRLRPGISCDSQVSKQTSTP